MQKETNIIIAEYLGWKDIVENGDKLCFELAAGLTGICPKTKARYWIPNFDADLDAMHEAEKSLTPEQICEYILQLGIIRERDAIKKGGQARDYSEIFSTSKQRSEALVKIIQKAK